MPVKSDPTMGWPQRSLAVRLYQMVEQHQREMGTRVAALRDVAGMTNESLARKSGLSVKTVSRFINGKHEPREHTLNSLAKALGVTPESIRGRPPAPLGLGAREDQVETGFEEFREHVASLHKRMDGLERALQDVTAELLALLKQQTKLLESLQSAADRLPDGPSLQDHLVQEVHDALARTAPPPEPPDRS